MADRRTVVDVVQVVFDVVMYTPSGAPLALPSQVMRRSVEPGSNWSGSRVHRSAGVKARQKAPTTPGLPAGSTSSVRSGARSERRAASLRRKRGALRRPRLPSRSPESISRAREQAAEAERLWADIADADLLFLTLAEDELQTDPSALVQTYRDAIPPAKRFAWGATRGQLALFAQLGHRAEAVRAVMQAFGDPDRHAPQQREQLIVFTGHRIDAPGTPPRFPATAEAKARALITERLRALMQGLQEGERLTVLASAAPGADLLVHEVCAELGVPSRLACRCRMKRWRASPFPRRAGGGHVSVPSSRPTGIACCNWPTMPSSRAGCKAGPARPVGARQPLGDAAGPVLGRTAGNAAGAVGRRGRRQHRRYRAYGAHGPRAGTLRTDIIDSSQLLA